MELDSVVRDGATALRDPAWNVLVDVAGTPFHRSELLGAWWRRRPDAAPGSRLLAVTVSAGGRPVGACALELAGGVLRFAGGTEVVDYMGPVAVPGYEEPVAEAVVDVLDALTWQRAELLGLVVDAPAALAFVGAFTARHPTAVVEPYDAAPGIDKAPDGYLALFRSKGRADVLRKRRMVEESAGPLTVSRSGPDDWEPALHRLLEWKRSASAETAGFVQEYSDYLEDLFSGLAGTVTVCDLRAGSAVVAAAIVLVHRNVTYLYNMSYDRSLRGAHGASVAPGVVLVSLLAEETLERGDRFDFLKGVQDYKVRLAGVPRDILGISLAR